MREEKKWWKKFSAYQIVAFVLTILFIIGTIITIAILTNLKDKVDDTKKKNDEIEKLLPPESPSTEASWQRLYENKIVGLKK